MASKTCAYCNESKLLTAFSSNIHSKDKLDHRCRVCASKQGKAAKKLRDNLINSGEFDKIMAETNDKCPICSIKMTKQFIKGSWNRGAIVDHDHNTGSFRGIICFKCNKALGMFNDSIEGLQEAINYLKKGLK